MKKYLGYICLFVVATMFGVSYVFQAMASNIYEPFTFTAFRFLLSAIILLPFIFKKDDTKITDLIKVGVIVGFFIFIATASQQIAAGKTSAGKIGFITSLYIVFVPLFNFLFYKKRINIGIFISIILALVGMALLCGLEKDVSINPYDFVVLIAAFAFAGEIIYIERNIDHIDVIKFTFSESVGAGTMSLIVALIFEDIFIPNSIESFVPLLYVAIGAGSLGYCLQNLGEAKTNSVIASLIMSLESVVSLLSGYLFLNETLSSRELLGCVIVLVAVVICILSSRKKDQNV